MVDYKEILNGTEYAFIKNNEHLGKHVILLGLAGSYSYGTNIDGSDIDVRGITLNQKSDLIRLFMMALDILEKGEINTYRVKEHDLLMDIRFGKYQKEDGTFKDSFYDLLADFEKRLNYAAENTDLPEEPDMKKVQDLVMTINERVIRDEI